MSGKLIVLEGTDGSGKSTQFARLCLRLEQEHIPFFRTVFPRYQQPSSALIRMYLNGELGARPGDVNPYAASAFYAVDRFAAYQQEWGGWHRRGGLVLADRYTTSNAVHQAAKLPPAERSAFFRWLYDFEFDRLGLPRPDLVLCLDMPTEHALALLRRRQAGTHTAGDIHETDPAYLALCRETALEAAACLGWQVVPCAAGDSLFTVEQLHSRLWDRIKLELSI